MRAVFLSLLLFLAHFTFAQKKGFEFLSYSKSAIESIVSNFSASIPDSSPVYKQFYLPFAKAYNKAKADYGGYRGFLKDCILDNGSKKGIQKCINSKTVDFKADLDTLQSVLETAYMTQGAIDNSKPKDPTYNGHNSSLITADFIKGIMDSLIGGALKIWDQRQKYKKQYRDDYLSNLTSKDYELAEIDDLLKKKPEATKK